MTITVAEAYMLHRLAPRSFPERILRPWTFAAGGLLIATAATFAWWAAIDGRPLQVSVEESRGIPLVSSDGIRKPTTDGVAPPAEIPIASSNEATEPVPQPSSPSARAEVRRAQKRDADHGPAPGLDFVPPEKSFTGAGRAFDAVH